MVSTNYLLISDIPEFLKCDYIDRSMYDVYLGTRVINTKSQIPNFKKSKSRKAIYKIGKHGQTRTSGDPEVGLGASYRHAKKQ